MLPSKRHVAADQNEVRKVQSKSDCVPAIDSEIGPTTFVDHLNILSMFFFLLINESLLKDGAESMTMSC